jgi:hypothetical protein
MIEQFRRDGSAPEEFVELLRERGEGGIGVAGLLHSISDAEFDAFRLEEGSVSEERLEALESGAQPTASELEMWRQSVRDGVFTSGEGPWNPAILFRVEGAMGGPVYGVVLGEDGGSWADVFGPFLTPKTALEYLKTRGEVFDVSWVEDEPAS